MSAYNSVPRRSSGPVLQSNSPSTRFNHRYSSTHNPSFNFAQTRPGSSTRVDKTAPPKRTCMCSPTNHPGSFRCSLHKSGSGSSNRVSSNSKTVSRGSSSRLNIRIGDVERDIVKRALAALIRPSSHNQRRRGEFRPRGSRLCLMSKA